MFISLNNMIMRLKLPFSINGIIVYWQSVNRYHFTSCNCTNLLKDVTEFLLIYIYVCTNTHSILKNVSLNIEVCIYQEGVSTVSNGFRKLWSDPISYVLVQLKWNYQTGNWWWILCLPQITVPLYQLPFYQIPAPS